MCGFVGAMLESNAAVRQDMDDIVGRAYATIAHRGPDDHGAYTHADTLWLRHGRLAIIDLSADAAQPMQRWCPVSGRHLALAFNGEIYNFQELRQELVGKGHVFESHSDTEVILHGFEEWGNECFVKLRGMFAVAIYDEGAKTLTLTRDRFGIKPLYVHALDKQIVFASEMKALFAFPWVQKNISANAARAALNRGYIRQPQTFWSGVRAVEPGVVLTIENNSITQTCFARLKNIFETPSMASMSWAKAVENVRAALLDSVSHHTIADVPVGVFLSGGIDSSALVALMRAAGQRDITSIAAIFPGTPQDESQKARLVAKTFGTNHVEIPISDADFAQHMERCLAAMDQPTVDGINTYFVSHAARVAGRKVVLSGLGGDELFYGYPSFWQIPAWVKLVPLLNNVLSRWLLSQAVDRDFLSARWPKLLELASPHNADSRFFHVYQTYRTLFTPAQLSHILRNDVFVHDQNDRAVMPDGVGGIRGQQKKISYLEISEYLRNQLLRDCDVMSMAHSIELRVPFVDVSLMRVLMNIPESLKVRQGMHKRLMVEALHGVLPASIVGQKKQGFVLPMERWLRGASSSIIREELLRSPLYRTEAITTMLDLFDRGRLHWTRIWILFVVSRFAKDV